jgi:acid stress-induced BolA-like protein IbaG/YrbA
MTAEEIVSRIQSLHPDAEVTPEGADCNFSVTIVSAQFEGQTPLQRQQPVMKLFRDEIANGQLHALSIRAKTPAEIAA